MGIKANFDMSAMRKYAYSKKPEFVEDALEAYKLACIDMVDRAKQTKTYQDQTHKLRSSIGCVLYHNGVEVFNYFGSTGGEMGNIGVQEGLAYARSIAERQGKKLIVSVVVAGADYALYVESKGLDVLTGSSLKFASEIKENFNQVKDAFKEHIQEKFNL